MIDVEVWMFIASNLLVFVVGGTLTVLSYKAQQRFEQKSLRYTTLGFALITVSTVVEAFYAPGMIDTGPLTESQLLVLYTIESGLIGLGLACIAYSVLQYE